MPELCVCNLCGSDDTEVVFHHRSGRIANRVCRRCGLAYLSPRPSAEETQALYREYEQAYPADYLRDPTSPFAVAARERANFVTRWVAGPARVLEFGSGYGHFVAALSERGARVQGIEPSLPQVNLARELGRAVEQGEVGDLERGAGFDLACSFHVLEHLRDPLAALRQVWSALAEKGLLILDVPDATRLPVTAIEHFYIATGQHLYAFTPAVLRAMLSCAGFELVHLAHHPMGLMHPSNLRAVARKSHAEGGDVPQVAASHVCEALSCMRSHHRRLEALGYRVEERLRAWHHDGRRAALYGGGFHTLGLLDLREGGSARLSCLVDDDASKWTTQVAGLPVRSPEAFRDGSLDAVLVSSLASEEPMARRVRELAPELEVATVYGERPLPMGRSRLYFQSR